MLGFVPGEAIYMYNRWFSIHRNLVANELTDQCTMQLEYLVRPTVQYCS
jgi:S-adenosylmethionine synthetase